MTMIKTYEDFEKEMYRLIDIDLTSYKERQMKRRIDFLIEKQRVKPLDESEMAELRQLR